MFVDLLDSWPYIREFHFNNTQRLKYRIIHGRDPNSAVYVFFPVSTSKEIQWHHQCSLLAKAADYRLLIIYVGNTYRILSRIVQGGQTKSMQVLFSFAGNETKNAWTRGLCFWVGHIIDICHNLCLLPLARRC